MTTVLGFSGKKQSGKDTLLTNISPMLKGSVKKYSFADGLKNFLVDVMGLRPEQVWGTDEQKNTKTSYLWENLPEFIRWENGGRWVEYCGVIEQQLPLFENALASTNNFSPERIYWGLKLGRTDITNPIKLRSGHMTARELMQVFGTDICRRMFTQYIWVQATFRAINRDKPDFAIIPDLRFPSELQGVKEDGGTVVRLTRNVNNGDEHPSETALDDYDWSTLGDNALVVPSHLNIEETKDYFWNWFSKKLEAGDINGHSSE